MHALPSPSDVPGGSIARSGLGGTEVERTTTAATVLAERSREMVRARIMQALARPRDMFAVRERLLNECKRPGFAESAWYRKPVGSGKFAEGFSVRFAEAALRAMGNIAVSQVIVYEDAHARTIAVMATDLETNASTDVEVTLEKTVERKAVKPGQTVLGSRINSYGDRVYLIEATEDEFAVKAASAIAKARRNVILQLLPGDIQHEATQQIAETRAAGEKAVDPASRRKQLIDRFATKLGIKVAQLVEYLGKPLDQATPEEMRDLRDLGLAIEDKETTWAAAMASREVVDEQTGEIKKGDPSKVIEAIERSKTKRAAPPPTTVTVTASEKPSPSQQSDAPSEDEELIRDAIDEADDEEGIRLAKAKLDAASARLSQGARNALNGQLNKAAGRLGVSL